MYIVFICNSHSFIVGQPIKTVAPAASKNDAWFKRGQNRLANNHLDLLIQILDTVCNSVSILEPISDCPCTLPLAFISWKSSSGDLSKKRRKKANANYVNPFTTENKKRKRVFSQTSLDYVESAIDAMLRRFFSHISFYGTAKLAHVFGDWNTHSSCFGFAFLEFSRVYMWDTNDDVHINAEVIK